MKIIIAMDSFKGCLGSMEAGNIIKESILLRKPDAEIYVFPMADGGEGTVEALVKGMNGIITYTKVCGPLGESIEAAYGIVPDRKLAIIEIAQIAGLPLVPEDRRSPMSTTTYGIGQVIMEAIGKGCRQFMIGLGGSATNDAGIGMLSALGYRFLNKDGAAAGITGKDVMEIEYIDGQEVPAVLKECCFRVACDVTNPLYGAEGATKVYGPQKGADAEELAYLEKALTHFAAVAARDIGREYAQTPGAGAAGGLGYAFLTFLDGRLESGRDIILSETGMEEKMSGADYVITGEGRLDIQTAMGKGPAGVARLGKKYGAKVIGLAGSVTKDVDRCNAEGMDACFSILQEVITIEEAMKPETAKRNLQITVEQLFALL